MAEQQNTPPPNQKQVPHTSIEKESSLPRIRTYAADMSRVIKQRGETLASIVNKEQTRATPQEKVPRTTQSLPYRSILIALGVFVFLLAGIGVVVGTFLFSPDDEVAVQGQSIIFANKTLPITTTLDTALVDELAVIRSQEEFPLGEILRVTVIENDVPLSAYTLARRLNMPDALAREAVEVMVGVHSFDRNQPFIIMRLGAYDRSFAALLSWESTIARSLGSFFAPLHSQNDTPPSLEFTDSIAHNLDTRRSAALWPILYTFPQQQLLVITTNEFTLREIITRLSSSRISF